MSNIEWSNVTAFAAELSDVPVEAQSDILNYVHGNVNVSEWPLGEADTGLRLARIYLAAHMGTFARPNSTGLKSGEIASQSEGGVSQSYSPGSVMVSASATGGTSYGRLYEQVIRPVFAGPRVM